MVKGMLSKKSGNVTTKSKSDINFPKSKKLGSAKSEPKQLLMKKSLTAKKMMKASKPQMMDFSQAIKSNQ